MALAAGARLGPYEVLGLIGAGGMGEVYRAKDTRLDRTVAIKILPTDISNDPHRRARFEREAKTIATLSHPHICTLHDVGERGSSLFLVMEHLEGQTLADRLRKGALPIEQSLEYGAQIAEALAAAHRAGIIHRDLKPENVMLTKSGVKLLDFGLAKLNGEVVGVGAVSATTVPDHRESLTDEGTILGTLHYMAPEQLGGKEADARTDIWALGVVLYEMVTGKRAFEGDSSASLIAAILERQPQSPSQLQPLSPALLNVIIGRCLAKAPEQRWDSAHDVGLQLAGLRDVQVPSKDEPRPRRQRLALGAFALLAVMLFGGFAAALLLRSDRQPGDRPIQRFAIPIIVPGVELGGGVAISPDGQRIAFVARDQNGSRLYLRRADEWDVHAVSGTENAVSLCFSPDNAWIAFFTAEGQEAIIHRIPVAGGIPQTISPARFKMPQAAVANGLIWLPNGRILFTPNQPPGIWSLPADGGTPELLVPQPNNPSHRARWGWPEVLPDGETLLISTLENGHASIAAWSPRSRKTTLLLEDAIRPRYVKRTGHLIYQSGSQLFAAPFDPIAIQVKGEARPVADQVGNGSTYESAYDISQTGALAYLSPDLARVVLKDRAGNVTFLTLKPRRYGSVSLSPDGRRAVLGVREGTAHRLYFADLDRGEPITRLTPGDDDFFGIFTRDGKRVVFTSGRGGRYNIFVTPADRGGEPERLTDSANWQKPTSISPRGPLLLFNDRDGYQHDIVQMNLDRPNDRPTPIIRTPVNEANGVLSPDGQLLAYEQATAGIEQVYVQAFPSGPRTQVSVDGGYFPVWNPKGGELFYESSDALMAVRITRGFRVGEPIRLFTYKRRFFSEQGWDVTPDGSRFLVIEGGRPPQINVVLNWFEELKAKVPANK